MGHWRHLRSILLLPATVTIAIPAAILWSTGSLTIGWGLAPAWQIPLLGVALLCLAAGLWLVVQTIALFATAGHGTLAPWDPPTKLVVRGVYRHVRNPMISGVFMILACESMLAGSQPLLLWCALFAIINMIYIPLLEEPGLDARFGEPYRRYMRHVPRWLPRRTAWEPEVDGGPTA